MPREPEVSPEYLDRKLKEWKLFDDKKQLKKKKDLIWEQIRKKLKLKMSSASLYLYVYKNVHGCRDKLEKHCKIQKKSVTVTKVKEADDDYEPHSQIKSQHTSHCPELLFDVIIQQSLIIASWNDKKHTTGWQHILRQAIWNAQHLPCSFSFPNYWITNDTKLKISGACSEAHCKSKIFAEGQPIDEENVKITIKCLATHDIIHETKNKLSGQRRIEAKKVMLNMLPSEYREQQLADLSTDYEPPHLNTTVTYRKLREEAINEHIGYSKFKNQSMTNKQFINYCHIRKLTLDPLNIYYWSEAQIEVWNLLHEQQLPLSFDATGSLVRRFSFYKGIDKSKALFYYVLVIGFKKKIIPLLQALLSSHHVPIIVEVFQRWIESGARIPKEICTDGSPTLQNAVCLAFNNMTYKNYNLHCYELLLNNKELEVPRCYYRLDVNHLIHTAKKDWTCFAKADSTVIDFYIRCIGYLTQVESLQQFEDVVESIIIVSNSVSMEKESLCYQKKESLIQLFKTYEQVLNKFATDSSQEEFATINENASKEPDHNTTDNLVLYINNLFERVINLCPQNTEITVQPNFYYCSEFTKPFKILCYTFTSWTNVMKKIFMSPNNVATSCRSETYNKDRKQAVPRPIIIAKFLLKERTKIAATTKFVFTRTRSTKDKNENISTHDNVLDLDLDKLVISNDTKTLFPDHIDHELLAPSDVQDVQFNSTVYGDIQTNELFQDLNLSQIPAAVSDQHFNSTLTSNGIEIKECFQDLNKLQTPAVVNDLNFQITHTYSPTKSNEETHKSIVEPSSDISIHKQDLRDLMMKFLNSMKERMLILNGSRISHKSYYIEGIHRSLSFKNTCPFDSIFELISSIYLENNNFRNILSTKLEDESAVEFLHAIFAYCENEDERYDLDDFYHSRASILYRKYKDSKKNLNKSIIDCQDNVIVLFSDLMKLIPSLVEISQCPCGFQQERLIYTSDISTSDFYNIGIKNLELILSQYLIEKKVYCHFCENRSTTLDYELQNYIAIDLEFLYVKQNIPLIQRTVKNAIIQKTNLDEVPKKIILKDKVFELKGIICFEGEYIQEKSIVHYKTYVLDTFPNENIKDNKEIKSKWKLYDSLATTFQEILSPAENIALILFVEI